MELNSCGFRPDRNALLQTSVPHTEYYNYEKEQKKVSVLKLFRYYKIHIILTSYQIPIQNDCK